MTEINGNYAVSIVKRKENCASHEPVGVWPGQVLQKKKPKKLTRI